MATTIMQKDDEERSSQLMLEKSALGGLKTSPFRCRGPTTPLAGVRFVIEFSSILLLAFLCIMHEFSDVTMAKQLHIEEEGEQQTSLPQHFNSLEGQDCGDAAASITHGSQRLGKASGESDGLPLISFSPESLDFGSRPIGLPVTRTVHVANHHERINIQMISISGTTEHFHCSFFEEKVIAPGTNTTFQVVFLGRKKGLVNNTLYIHSSVGSFSYRVSANGIASPFRIRPLIGARVPVNGSFASLIHIHNPFSTPLQLTEIYSSGGGLFLDLPDELHTIEDDELEDLAQTPQQQQPKKAENMPESQESQQQQNPPKEAERLKAHVWHVPPYETRPVVRAQFVGREAYNHSSYIRIRTNASDVQIVLPIEVEVSHALDLYSPVDVIDFGTVRRDYDGHIKRAIMLVNAARKPIHIQSITIKDNKASKGVKVTDVGTPLRVPNAQSSAPFHVANLLLVPSNSTCEGFCMGKLIIKTDNNNQLIVPFLIRMIPGKLEYDTKQSYLFLAKPPGQVENHPWELTVRNRFKQPLLIHAIKLIGHKGKSCFRFLETEDDKGQLRLPIVLGVNEEKKVVKLAYSDSNDKDHRFQTALRFKTNVTNVDIPIHVFRGFLDLFIPNVSDRSNDAEARGTFDFGFVGISEHKTAYFYLINDNPVNVKLVMWQCDINGVIIHFAGIQPNGESKTIDAVLNDKDDKKATNELAPTVIPSGHHAVFRIILASHDNRAKQLPIGSYKGKVLVRTQYEDIRLPITFTVLNGSLQASKIMLPRSFPGKVVTANIMINSSYKEALKIKGTFVEPTLAAITSDKVIIDNRFSVSNQTGADGTLLLAPQAVTPVQVVFDANELCLGKLCYTALDVEREVGNLWLLSTSLVADTAYIDKELYILLRNQWSSLTSEDKNPMAKVRFQVQGYGSLVVEVSGRLYWPLLANKMLIQFPSTRLGRTVKKEFLLENPGDMTILVQLMSLEDYPNPEVIVQMMEAGMFQQRWARADIEAINATWRTRWAGSGAVGTFTKPFILFNSSMIASDEKLHADESEEMDNHFMPSDEKKRAGANAWMKSASQSSFTLTLPPGARQRVTVAFHPLVEGNVTSVLIMRNNLTILDVITLKGEGGRGFLRINSVTNSGTSGSPIQRLLFDYNEKTLERICNGNGENDARQFLINRKFRATNIGRMGMTINRLLVDDVACESNGFLISHCKPIYLNPKQWVDFEVIYSPDFTQPEVRHHLSLMLDDDDENVQRYPMVVKIPKKLLPTCHAKLPSLPWASSLKLSLLAATFVVLFLSLAIGIADSRRILGELKSQEESLEDSVNLEREASVDPIDCAALNGGNAALVKVMANGAANRKKTVEMNGTAKTANTLSGAQQQSKMRKRTRGAANSSTPNLNGQQKEADKRDNNNVPNGRQNRYKQANRTSSSDLIWTAGSKTTVVDKSLPASVLRQNDQMDEINSWGFLGRKKASIVDKDEAGKGDKKLENGACKQAKNHVGQATKGESESGSNSTESSTTGGRACRGGGDVSSSRSSSVSPSENLSAASSVKNIEKLSSIFPECSTREDAEKLAWNMNNEGANAAFTRQRWKQGKWESAEAGLSHSIELAMPPAAMSGLAVGEERMSKARALTMPSSSGPNITDFLSSMNSPDLLAPTSQSTTGSCIANDQWSYEPGNYRNLFDDHFLNVAEEDKKSGERVSSWFSKNGMPSSNVPGPHNAVSPAGSMFQNFLASTDNLHNKHSAVKDIWDMPITNFVSTKAKRNEYNDMEHQHRFAFGSWENSAGANAATSKPKDSNQQPWKIGEWSNELAKNSGVVVGSSKPPAPNNSMNDNVYYYNQHRNQENIFDLPFFKNRERHSHNGHDHNQAKPRAMAPNKVVATANRLAGNHLGNVLPLQNQSLQVSAPPAAASNSLGANNRNPSGFFSPIIERPTSSNSSTAVLSGNVKNVTPPPGLERVARYKNMPANINLDDLVGKRANDRRGMTMAQAQHPGLFDDMEMFMLREAATLNNQRTVMDDMATLFAAPGTAPATETGGWSNLDSVHSSNNKPTRLTSPVGSASLFDSDAVWTSNSPAGNNPFWKHLPNTGHACSVEPSPTASKNNFAWPISTVPSGFGHANKGVNKTIAPGGGETQSPLGLSSSKWSSFDTATDSLFSPPPLLNVMDTASPWPSASSSSAKNASLDSNVFNLTGVPVNGQPATTPTAPGPSLPSFNDIYSDLVGTIANVPPACRNVSPLSTGSNASSVATNSVGSTSSTAGSGTSGIGGSSTGAGSNPSPNSPIDQLPQASK